MKINSAQLDAFYTVARLLNFTRAAESLHVTQSALSQRVAKLEEDLEVTLFIRDRSSIRLTEAGEQVMRFCQLSDSAEGDLLSRLKGTREQLGGSLRVGGFSSVNRSLVVPALKKLMHKNVQLALHLMTREIAELDELLRRSEVDYILTVRKSESPDIRNIFLGFEENVLVRSRKHGQTEIFLDHDENDPTTRSYFAQNKITMKAANMRYLDDVYGLIDGVKEGFGKAVLPLHLIEDERDLEIVDPKRILRVPVYLQFYVQPFYRAVHTPFVESIQTHFQDSLRQK
ncbi:MAG: LysR family transcriptional regulator [Bdellovibrionaceae bacterium]|nr:LysR family transcriptional regulator [Pseudobdellovibrionaceae bacterium]